MADRETGDGCRSSSPLPGNAQIPEPSGTGLPESTPADCNPILDCGISITDPNPEHLDSKSFGDLTSEINSNLESEVASKPDHEMPKSQRDLCSDANAQVTDIQACKRYNPPGQLDTVKRTNPESDQQADNYIRSELDLDIQDVDDNVESECNDHVEQDFRSEDEKLVHDILRSKQCQQDPSCRRRDKTGNKQRALLDLESAGRSTTNDQASTEEDVQERWHNITLIDSEQPLDQEDHTDPDDQANADKEDQDQLDNPSIQIEETSESFDEFRLIPSAQSSSKSSLGNFFHQKLFRSPSASSSSALTNSSSSHSSPETKCVHQCDQSYIR